MELVLQPLDSSSIQTHSLSWLGKYATFQSSSQSNPASRIGEKFLEWSDQDPPLDDILTNVSLYWFTNGFPRSIYPYREMFGQSRIQMPYISKPFGFSWFPKEIFPGIESEVKQKGDLVFYRQQKNGGGHFAALEKPQELWADVEEYVQLVWKKRSVL